jgi:tetratricopeptide (TPR) repeat protein
MSGTSTRRRLSTGKQKKLFLEYQAALRAFSRGDFGVALSRYGRLSEKLRPHFAAITARNLGVGPGIDEDLSPAEIEQTLAGLAPETLRRLEGTNEGRTAGLCSAVAHDVALIARHLAEGNERGRTPEVARAIIAGFAHAIAVNPQNPVNYHNLAGYEDYLGLNADASAHYRIALQLEPHLWESWVSWGHALARSNDIEGAETCWTNALNIVEAIDARERKPHWGIAMLRLMKCDYARGWQDYEARLSFPPYLERHGRPDLRAPRWDGREMSGVLYLHQEQGAGDAIMLARYIPLVQQRVGRVVVEVIKGMVTLFEAMFPGVDVVAKGDTPPAHDAQLPMFSLPAVFGTTLDTIPDPAPFWPTSAENVPIEAEPGRIGLCWRGSTTHPNDLVRSMPFEATFPMLDVPGFTWQSLQFGYETSPPLDPFPPGDFLETARLIARCDLVITVDTSIAHLAGSMGVQTWLLLPFSAEWRWLQHRPDSPWYPNMRLSRQTRAGDWRSAVRRVVDELELVKHVTIPSNFFIHDDHTSG